MDGRQTTGLMREQVRSSWLYQAFNWVFGILFAAVVVLIVFFNTNTYYNHQWGLLLLSVAAGILLAFIVSRLFGLHPQPSVRAEAITVAALFVVFAAAQVLVSYALEVRTTEHWNFGVVYNFAERWVLEGALPDEYFLHFPSNQGLYTLYCGFFSILHLFGVNDFHLPMTVLNILCINGALVLMYFCARRLFGSKKALFLLVAGFCTLPFLLYVPVYYTDTLTLPFPVAIVLLWLKARACWREGNVRGTVARFLALSALAAVGGLLKLTVLIVFIAVVLDLLILLRGAKRLLVGLGGAALCAALVFGGSLGLKHSPMLPQYDYDDGIPFTHWIMMGLHGDGGYHDPDYQATLAVEGMQARYAFTTSEITERIAVMGPLGTVQHIGHKLSYTFGDGLYAAADKLNRQPVRPGALHQLVTPGGSWYWLASYYAFAVQAAILAWAAVAAIKSFFRRNHALTFVRVALFGLTLFLLIWETSTSYLLNCLPLFLLCAVEAAPAPRLILQKVRAKLVVGAAYAQDPGQPLPDEATAFTAESPIYEQQPPSMQAGPSQAEERPPLVLWGDYAQAGEQQAAAVAPPEDGAVAEEASADVFQPQPDTNLDDTLFGLRAVQPQQEQPQELQPQDETPGWHFAAPEEQEHPFYEGELPVYQPEGPPVAEEQNDFLTQMAPQQAPQRMEDMNG